MASDTAKFLAVRVAQVPNVVMEDNETTFPELQDRISATIAFLKKVPPHAMDSREDAETIIPMRSRTIASKGKDYTLNFAIPNFFFHITVAYSLLRHNGVPIGKMDFLGTL